MVRWSDFAAAEPEMAKDGRDLFYRVGIGLGYLATDEAEYAAAKASYEASGGKTDDGETLFEFQLEKAMHAKYKARPDWPPTYRKWSAGR